MGCFTNSDVVRIKNFDVEKSLHSLETGFAILMIFGDLYLLLEAEIVDQILDLGTADDQEEGDLLSCIFALDGFLLCISLCGLLGVYMKEKVQHRCLLVHFLGGGAFVLLSPFVAKPCLDRCQCMRILSINMARNDIDTFMAMGLVVGDFVENMCVYAISIGFYR